jgi:7,8-dihydroneopterin aldolase/epimerase/oxygenase
LQSARPAGIFAAMVTDFSATAGTYRVFVRNLILSCSIGTYAHEKRARQRVRINVELLVDGEPKRGSDELRDVLNYEPLIAGIKAIAAAGHIHLVETVAERILEIGLADDRVAAARVTVEKLDVYPEAESVGIVLERRRRSLEES